MGWEDIDDSDFYCDESNHEWAENNGYVLWTDVEEQVNDLDYVKWSVEQTLATLSDDKEERYEQLEQFFKNMCELAGKDEPKKALAKAG